MPANRNLLLVAVIIVIAELLLIAFVVDAVQKRLTESLITQEIDRQGIIVSQLARTLEDDHQGLHDRLSLLARHPDILTGSPAKCQTELEKATRFSASRVDNLLRIDRKGEIYCAQNTAALGINVLKNDSFKALFENPGDKKDHTHIMHRVTLSPVSGEYVVGMHMAVFSDQNQFQGSLGGAIYLSRLKERYFENLSHFKRGSVSLIDDNGDILYHPLFPQLIGKNLLSEEIVGQLADKDSYLKDVNSVLADIKTGKTSVIRYHYPPEPEKIAVYYPVKILPNRHWAVVSAVPIDEITNQLDDSSLVSGLKSFTSLLIATAVIILVTQVSLFAYLMTHLKQHQGVEPKDD